MSTDAQDPQTDDMRRKFREALERKNHQSHATAEAPPRDGSEKSHGADGPTGVHEFRRKTGGGGA